MFPTMALSFLKGITLKQIIIGILVIVALGIGYKMVSLHKQVNKLTEQVLIITSERDKAIEINKKLNVQIDSLVAINKQNDAVIAELQTDKVEADRLLKQLNKQLANNKAGLAEAKARLNEMLKDPANNGPVSNALKDTLKSIEDKRKARR